VTGKSVEVEDMSYSEWKKKYVDGVTESGVAKTNEAVETSNSQFKSYKKKYVDVPNAKTSGKSEENVSKDVANDSKSDIIKLTEKQRVLQSKIDDGSITLNINPDMQKIHMQNSKKDGRSYFTISEEELQEIVNAKHGTGTIRINADGQIRETIECDKI
jgi:hypothetical protein